MKAYKIIKSNIHRKGLCAARNIKKAKELLNIKEKKLPINKQMRMISMAMILPIYLRLIKNMS